MASCIEIYDTHNSSFKNSVFLENEALTGHGSVYYVHEASNFEIFNNTMKNNFS